MSNCRVDNVSSVERDPVFLSQKGKPGGVAVLDSSGKVPLAQINIDAIFTERDPVYTADRGQPFGVATLGGNSLVPRNQLGTGTADATVFLRGDGVWATASGGDIPSTRTINTNVPLTGGGDLSVDRTFGISNFGASGPSHSRGVVPDPGAVAGTTRFLREDGIWQPIIKAVFPSYYYGDGSTGDLTLVGDTTLPQAGNAQAFGTYPANSPSYQTLDLGGFTLFQNINDYTMYIRAKIGVVGSGHIICKIQEGGTSPDQTVNDHGGNGHAGAFGQGTCVVLAKEITGGVDIGAVNAVAAYGNKGGNGEDGFPGLTPFSGGPGSQGQDPTGINNYWMGRTSTSQDFGHGGQGGQSQTTAGAGGAGGAAAITTNTYQMFALVPQLFFSPSLGASTLIENLMACNGLASGGSGGGYAQGTTAGTAPVSGGGGSGGGGGLGRGGHGGDGVVGGDITGAGSGGGGGAGGGAGGLTLVGTDLASSDTTVNAGGGDGGDGGNGDGAATGGVGAGGGGGVAIGTCQPGSGWVVQADAGIPGQFGGTTSLTSAQDGMAYDIS